MRQLLPHPITEVNPLAVYPTAARPRPDGRPWLMLNMIVSVDGAIAVEGTSRALGSPTDRAVFEAVRASADWIVVAAGTVRAERYRIPRPGPDARQSRLDESRAPQPSLAVVSSTLDLGPDLPMLADQRSSDTRPLVLTGRDAPTEAVKRFDGVAEVVRLPVPRPTPEAILAELAGRGALVVLSEGGPTFNAQLIDSSMVDELCLSTAPVLAGGRSPRLVHGSARTVPVAMDLVHLSEADGMLFARYVSAIHRDSEQKA